MSVQKPRAFYLIGPPASGKGTHGKLIGALPGWFHFSMGQAFRSLKPRSQADREELLKVHALTARGYLADDDLTQRVFDEYFDGMVASRRFRPDDQILILDGVPRRRSQAEWMMHRVELIRVIQFVCDEKVILKRIEQRSLEQGRVDDTLDVVRTRLNVYQKELGPMLDFFSDDMIECVDSTDSPTRVLWRVLGIIEESLPSQK